MVSLTKFFSQCMSHRCSTSETVVIQKFRNYVLCIVILSDWNRWKYPLKFFCIFSLIIKLTFVQSFFFFFQCDNWFLQLAEGRSIRSSRVFSLHLCSHRQKKPKCSAKIESLFFQSHIPIKHSFDLFLHCFNENLFTHKLDLNAQKV